MQIKSSGTTPIALILGKDHKEKLVGVDLCSEISWPSQTNTLKSVVMVLRLCEFMSCLQKAFKVATYFFFFLFDVTTLPSFFVVFEKQDVMNVDQNGAVLHDSGLYLSHIYQY